MFRMKKCAALALCLCLCAAAGTAPKSFAAGPLFLPGQGEIVPYALYIQDQSCKLSISGTTATVEAWVMGQPGIATHCSVAVMLQEKSGNNWVSVGAWGDSQDGTRASVSETVTVEPGKTYRAKATVSAESGSQYESKTLTTPEKTS